MSEEISVEATCHWCHRAPKGVARDSQNFKWPSCGEEHGAQFEKVSMLVAKSRWENTSYADSIEAAVHMALVEFILVVDARNREHRGRSRQPDMSDIYINTRRTIRRLITGQMNADEYLEDLEDLHES